MKSLTTTDRAAHSFSLDDMVRGVWAIDPTVPIADMQAILDYLVEAGYIDVEPA
jgi:hypothetical protein